jgi:hypothetical protein
MKKLAGGCGFLDFSVGQRREGSSHGEALGESADTRNCLFPLSQTEIGRH